MDHAINLVISAIVFIGGLVFWFVAIVDAFFASLMLAAGIPPVIQLVILIVVAVVLVALALRALGGVLAALIVVLLVLLVLHKAFPGVQPPHFDLSLPGTVHT